MKRKITRRSLENLSNELPVIEIQEQANLIGGGTGTEIDPYTMSEYDNMVASGTWGGGFVEVGSSFWSESSNTGSIQGDRARGIVYLKSHYSYDAFERLAVVGAWTGGLVRMRDGSIRYLGKDAEDDDNIINITGNDNIDRMFTAGYKMGYSAGRTPDKWDDIVVGGSGLLDMGISGHEFHPKGEDEWAMWYYGYGKSLGLWDEKKSKSKP